MSRKILLVTGVLFAVSGNAATLPALSVQGAIPVKLTLANHQTKIVRLMNIQLSNKAVAQLSHHLTDILARPNMFSIAQSRLPEKVQLGMNDEPVLDQGQWGTCATFATTGSVNAFRDYVHGARVSQLCNLELGVTLDNPPGADGGWQGSFASIVFNQMSQYGIVDLDSQRTVGCGGLEHYPAQSQNNGVAMTVDQFEALKTAALPETDWTPIWAYDGSFQPMNIADGDIVLHDVKRALKHGYRVVFGSLLDPYVGQAGAVGSYDNASDDAWVMTPEIKADIAAGIMAGHEIIIDGYDDKACASYQDSKGSTQEQCGLLHIRNSWGPDAGVQGDYFMSYDHFVGMAIEVYAVGDDVKDHFKPTPHAAG